MAEKQQKAASDEKHPSPPEVPRSALFTVRDAEATLIRFTVLVFLYTIGVVVYEIRMGWSGFLSAGQTFSKNTLYFLGVSTVLLACREGVDIMFRRVSEYWRDYAAGVKQAKAEGIEQGIEQGKAEGIEQGKAEVQELWLAWNNRREEAAAKGRPFNEPPPASSRVPRADV